MNEEGGEKRGGRRCWWGKEGQKYERGVQEYEKIKRVKGWRRWGGGGLHSRRV